MLKVTEKKRNSYQRHFDVCDLTLQCKLENVASICCHSFCVQRMNDVCVYKTESCFIRVFWLNESFSWLFYE